MGIRKRLEISGRALIFVTTTVTDWIPIFSNEAAANIAMEVLRDNLEYFKASAIGYVLMPSHIHGLFCFSQVELLSRFMQTFKILTSKRIKKLEIAKCEMRLWRDGKFGLWQPRFDDLVIVSAKQFQTKLAYIHSNPVRAGLVKKEIAWPYSSAKDWLTVDKGPIKIDTSFEWSF